MLDLVHRFGVLTNIHLISYNCILYTDCHPGYGTLSGYNNRILISDCHRIIYLPRLGDLDLLLLRRGDGDLLRLGGGDSLLDRSTSV